MVSLGIVGLSNVLSAEFDLLILAAALIGVTSLIFAAKGNVWAQILKAFDTPNIVFSTLSITTSFMAASLTILRSSYFAAFYASNDVVLIVLWTLATLDNPVYFPVIINFAIFLINDLYGFFSWRKREREVGQRV